MQKPRYDSKEAVAGRWFGAREEAQMPVPHAGYASHTAAPDSEPLLRKKTVAGTILRIVRNAAIVVALMALVPIAVVQISGTRIWRNTLNQYSFLQKLQSAEPFRQFSLPKDPSITPMQAGLAYGSLEPPQANSRLPLLEKSEHLAMPWRAFPKEPISFPGMLLNSYVPRPTGRILTEPHNNLSARQMELLQIVASAPVWHDFDLVARAPAVDLLGGRFATPFPANAGFFSVPPPQYNVAKELANAGVARAAYYLSKNRADSAEFALRAIVSYGFVLMDQGTTYLDQSVGRAVVEIGRDGLHQLFLATGDSRAALAAVQKIDGSTTGAQDLPRRVVMLAGPSANVRQKLIDLAGDPTISRAQRYQSLYLLSTSACTNVRELLTGPDPSVSDAFARARRDFARYPSERALVDITSRTLDVLPVSNEVTSLLSRLAIGSATVAGIVLRNPHLAACTRIATGAVGNPLP